MKLNRRFFLLGASSLAVAGCAGPAPKEALIDQTTRDDIRISNVVVDVSKIGEHTTGRKMSAQNVHNSVQNAANAMLRNQGQGSRAVQVQIDIDSVNFVNATQSILVGGESIMTGHVTVVDASTGDVLLPATKISSGGGGWTAGGIIAAATQEDVGTEIRQMSLEFASRSRIVILGA